MIWGVKSESKKRSFAKAVTYRLLIMCSDAIIIFAITRRYDVTIGVIVLSNVASTILYFLHERVWNRAKWGKING